ncbi:MAG: TlpA disulfide reductase family protein [Acidobacteriota bacterium]
MKIRELHVLTTNGKQEMGIILRKTGRNHPPGELVPVRPGSGPGAHIARLKIVGLLAAIAVLIAAGLHPVRAVSQEYGAPKVPDFSILANDGQTYSPDYLKGNVVLIMFWATWCPYCRRAMPHMNDLASEYANAEFTLLGICGSKDPNAWHNYIQQHHMQWPQYMDRDLRMAHLFGAHGVPNFFLIDKDGYLVAHWEGWDDSMAGQVEKLIDHTLARPRRR